MAVTSPYDGLTPEAIKAEMLAELMVKGSEIDHREGSYANTLVSVAAYQLYKLYQLFPSMLSMVFPDENAGEYIDKNAAQLGMTRAPGKKASTTIRFTGTDGTVIPAGTALYAPESGLQYLTTGEAVIAGGTAETTAEAAEVGSDYNLPAGYVTSMYINVAGVVTVTNATAATGGVDEESDAALYARYHDRRTLPITSGNKNHYIMWATETAGVGYASCVPLWNGNGTVKVVIAGEDRGPVDEGPIGATVTVVSVREREIPLTAKVTLMPGHTTEQVGDQVEAAVNELLKKRTFGEAATIPYSRFLACLLQCPGVADYSELTVDGGTTAVTLDAEDAAVVGTITITETA